MKKTISALILAAGVVVSVSASAADIINKIGEANKTQYGVADCILLNETVTLNLSNKVFGAFSCTEADNVIKVATCHSAGYRVSGITCTVIGSDTTVVPNVPIFNNPACALAGEVIEGADYRGYTASSSGGSVGEAFLGGNCTIDSIAALPQLQ